MKVLVVFVILLHVSQHALAVLVEVYEGQRSVLLPCQYSGIMPEDPTVMWTRSDLDPKSVHLQQEGGDDLRGQNQRYSGRTSMRPDALDTGDFSLTLRTPQLTDSSSYTCSISNGREERRLTDVQLQVKELFPSWATALLVLLGLFVVSGLLFYFRHYFMSDYEVQVDSGVESVQLPCKALLNLFEDTKVEWKDGHSRKVHVYQSSSDQPGEQDDFYRGRTEMKRNFMLKTGDLSLTLKHPTDSDTYTCTAYNKDRNILMKKQVELSVRVPQVEADSGVESVQLPCKTKVHLPEGGKVKWTNTYNVTVHVHQKGQHGEQHRIYKDRTKMDEDLLNTGDFSLTLKYPTDGNTGTYTCTAYNREGDIWMRKQVELKVRDCQVEVEEGAESVQLPFKTTGNLPEDATIEWEYCEPGVRKVHVYHNGSDQPKEQDQNYRGRTRMNEEPLRTGDLSLTLEQPTERDSGRYRCEVKKDFILLRRKTLFLKGSFLVQNKRGIIRNRSSSIDPTPLMAD
ncbi:butyrophilin-like protein 2 isoform X2 [Archocentrus centrarchus]|uniref:butyrophilin-like protein 2 isoform X2 n=1 Tax=Archocentrus centrarchus TaxID=63155 RepID=UPI0011E9CA04|nr:butyrophilin-like protein 2 isoform X2 [Archocentrus centrarchus]